MKDFGEPPPQLIQRLTRPLLDLSVFFLELVLSHFLDRSRALVVVTKGLPDLVSRPQMSHALTLGSTKTLDQEVASFGGGSPRSFMIFVLWILFLLSLRMHASSWVHLT